MLHSRHDDDEDFRIKDIQNEADGFNAFKASLAYMSLALEFHEYEVQQLKHQHDDSSVQPHLSRLYAGQYHIRGKRNKRTGAWIREKRFKQSENCIRKHLACGQKLCLVGKRLADGWSLESKYGSLIPILIRTFMSTKFQSSCSALDRNMPSLIDDDEIRQLAMQYHDWLDTCNAVYHKRDGLLEGFRHTCGIRG